MKPKTKSKGVLLPHLIRYSPVYLIGLAALFMVDYVQLFIPQFMGDRKSVV